MSSAAAVIVVGGGPAGAVTALLLARAGHDVLLLDRSVFPRPKPCGDCLSAGAAGVLSRLGLLERVQALPHGRLEAWRIATTGGASFTTPIGPPGHAFAVERRVLDEALLAAAADAGVRVVQGVRVSDVLRRADGTVCGVMTHDGPARTRLVVGADGLRSVVARRLGAVLRPARLRKLSLTLHATGAFADGRTGEMYAGPDGCVGVAPVGGGACNVTVVVPAHRRREVAADPHAVVRGALAAVPRLRGRIPDDVISDTDLLASGPFDVPVRRAVFDGAALAGDAAGYYDPFTGQGICHALIGAELLASVADRALRHGDCSARALAPYERELRRRLRPHRLIQRGVEVVLSRPALGNAAVRWLAGTPLAARRLVAVIGHSQPPATLLTAGTLLALLRPAYPLTENP